MKKVSIILPVYNDIAYISDCINSILNQTFSDFELIIVDDHSSDGVYEKIKEFQEDRISIFRNDKNLGIPKTRNVGLKKANSEYIFYTDSDCIVDKEWIKNGLIHLEKGKKVIEGYTYYVRRGYKTTISDKTPGKVESKGQWMTCNIAFEKKLFNEIGMFNENLRFYSDRELALRIIKQNEIYYCSEMIVCHQEKLRNIKSVVCSAEKVLDRLYLYKVIGDKPFMFQKIMEPRNFLKIIIPPLIILPVFSGRVKRLNDIKLLPFFWIKYLYERLLIWKFAYKNKIFVI